MRRCDGSLSSLSLGFLATFFAACATTSHPVAEPKVDRAGVILPGTLPVAHAPGDDVSLDALVEEPGRVTVETVLAADWQVPLSGLLNLDHPKAKAAKLEDRAEPIHVAFHAIHHPSRGTFLVDTGVERALFEAPDRAAIRGIVATVAKVGGMRRRIDTKTWLEQRPSPVAGVFLTHLHLDHLSGMRDIPDGTPVFVGPNEATARNFENLFVAGTVDRALANKPPLTVLPFRADRDGSFVGVLDVFGDRTVFALHVPGHTEGSTAFVVRTPSGPVLLTGDACHTAWGWKNGVEPGTFSMDRPKSRESLERLRRFAARHPKIEVRLGHQALE